MQNRKSELNYIRTIAMIAVVMIHTASFYPWFVKSYYTNWYFIYHQLTSFSVPSFICISGIVLSLKYMKSEFHYLNFLKSRFIGILTPYLIVSILYLIYTQDILKKSAKNILISLLTGQSFFHLYFVIIIMQLYLLFPLFRYLSLKIKSLFCFLPLLLIQYYFTQNSIFIFPFIEKYFRTSFFLEWFFIFLLGCYIGVHYDLYKNIIDKYINGIIGITTSLIIYKIANFYYIVFYLKKSNLWSYAQVQSFENILYTFCIIGLVTHFSSYIKNNYIMSLSNVLSQNSFGVYLYHMFVLRFFKYLIEYFKIHVNNLIILSILIITIVLSTIFSILINKIPFGYLIVGKNK